MKRIMIGGDNREGEEGDEVVKGREGKGREGEAGREEWITGMGSSVFINQGEVWVTFIR